MKKLVFRNWKTENSSTPRTGAFSTIFYFLFSIFPVLAVGQTVLDRQLIGSGHTLYDNGVDFTLSASVGEVKVNTHSTTSLIITEGFQQSNYVLAHPLIADLRTDSAACIGANDGAITVTFVSHALTTPLTYQWSTGATTEGIAQLEVGTYTVTITGANSKSVTNTARVSPRDSVNCSPRFYTGITPNNDGDNDHWHIDNAEFFTVKKVSIFNRYGSLVWKTEDYNNNGDAFTGTAENGNNLPDGTYYYIATFDNSTFKGWVEISR